MPFTTNEEQSCPAGYVYFIQAGDGLTKIGFTKNIARRLAALQTTSPTQLTLIHAIPSPNPVRLEQEYHARFASRRVRGEWFSLAPWHLAKIKARKSGIPSKRTLQKRVPIDLAAAHARFSPGDALHFHHWLPASITEPRLKRENAILAEQAAIRLAERRERDEAWRVAYLRELGYDENGDLLSDKPPACSEGTSHC